MIKDKIEQYLETLEQPFSGSVLVHAKGETIFARGYGYANYELDTQNTLMTKYRIGSVTKQFTAVCILILNEQGLIKLGDTVSQYLPDYPDGEKVTIHHLLTHTSGIFNYTNIPEFMTRTMRTHYSTQELIRIFEDIPYEFEPGTAYSYSNSGYHILGYIIEQVTDMSYGEFVQENIFDVLSMNHSGYDSQKKIVKNRASGYIINEALKIENCPFIDMHIPHAAGGLYSTVEDLLIWNTAIHNQTFLSRESYNHLTTPHVKKKEGGHYCYGINLYNDDIGDKKIREYSHGGGIPGFFAANRCYVDHDVQLIAITNINDPKFTNHVDKLAEIIFDHY